MILITVRSRFVVVLAAGFLLATLVLPARPAWALGERAVAFVTGQKQGLIQGDETNKTYGAGGIVLQSVAHELVATLDVNGQPTGKRVHRPLQIVKVPDKASPKLLTALVTNEVLTTVVIRFFRTATTGAVVLYHTFTLSNAHVVGVQTGGDTNTAGGVTEAVSFIYEKIRVDDNVNGFSAEDTWVTPF